MVSLNNEVRKLREENDKLKSEQVQRLPNLDIEINDSKELNFDFPVEGIEYYKERKPIELIPSHLEEILSHDEVNKYNQEIAKIDDEKIKKYNSLIEKEFALLNLQQPLRIKLKNLGNLKASNIYITISCVNNFSSQNNGFGSNLRLNNNLENKDSIERNRVKIIRANLLHNLMKTYSDYTLVPLSRGEGIITVSLHCEDYLESELLEIPITVN